MSSNRDQCLNVLMTPQGSSTDMVVQPAYCLHLLSSLALFGVVDDKIHTLSLLWVEHPKQFIGFHCKRLLRVSSPHVEEIIEPGAVGKRVGINISIQRLYVSPFLGDCNEEHQHLKVFKMFIKKLRFQGTEKVVEFGGETDDLKHERQPPMCLVCDTIFIGWFAFLFDIFPSLFYKKSVNMSK